MTNNARAMRWVWGVYALLLLCMLGVHLDCRATDRGDETDIGMAVYYEARGESNKGKLAVACVVLNRVAHPDYPKTIREVVYQRGPNGNAHFSWLNDFRDGKPYDARAMREAINIAYTAMNFPELCQSYVKQATFFANVKKIGTPWWVRGEGLVKVADIGNHRYWQKPVRRSRR